MKPPTFRTLPTLRLSGLSVLSFLRAPLPAAALAALVLVPLLYSGLYLWSFWDPFGRTGDLPVALVNEDRPATADGEELAAGDELADTLTSRDDLDWHLVDEREAEAGVRDGRYYVALTIPEDFSANLAAPSDENAEPDPAMLEVQYDDANNYIARQLLSAAFGEVESAAGESAIGRYFDTMFLGFNEIHGRTQEAAEGAGELSEGADDAEDGSGDLHEGLGDAEDGSDELSSGLAQLHDGSSELADGSATASDEVSDAVDKIDSVADDTVPLLEENAEDVEDTAETVADAADTVATAVDELPETSEEDLTAIRDTRDRLDTYLEENPDLEESDPQLYTLLTDARDVADDAAAVNGFVHDNRDRIDTIGERASTVHDVASDIADAAPDAADKVEDVQDKANKLDTALQDIADGSSDLEDGLEEAHEGSVDLNDGISALHSGAGDLSDGLSELNDGSEELAAGLDDGVDRIPTYDGDERDSRQDMMSGPVQLSSVVDNEAPNYGTGFAPFFITLSLWVGTMVTYMVLPAAPKRALAASAPAWRVALSGWFPALAVGGVQVLAMLGVLHFMLGLDAQRWLALIGLLALTSATFAAMVQWINARFGPAGRILALALLMLQLTSAGGTYPIQTSHEFFQTIAPYLPMSWVVSAARHLVSGGPLDAVWGACAVLTCYLLVSLLLTWVTTARSRTWTVGKLYPALSL
ncbi:putative membrane protein [Haloactinospora alba]|uniref:Putative membrane protein n=1 Tax=Haloactinospora alba TaxID=405555 RepID=A0A543NLL1_9ACTN|nr:YhgE/Pip domain-containing protein [Haloactinospora alba]TQN32728.1 putative membrane protein [Haloactinospora alba]